MSVDQKAFCFRLTETIRKAWTPETERKFQAWKKRRAAAGKQDRAQQPTKAHTV